MQRPVIEDVLDVLHEIREAHRGPGGGGPAVNLRHEAVLAVALRELAKGRFSNEVSARNSILDACSRRLDLTIAGFDEAVALMLAGDPSRLGAILRPVPKNEDHGTAVERLLAGWSQVVIERQGTGAAPKQATSQPHDDLLGASRPGTERERPSPQVAIDFDDAPAPERRATLVSRIIRDTAMVRSLKERYGNHCQLCDVSVDLGNGNTYSEGHHIRPLGKPHDGPDAESNILILCPNHHAQCDYRAIRLTLSALHLRPDHTIDEDQLAYHNSLCADA